jgi:D-alanyl-D-alanine carboxypeptidase
MNFLKSNLLLLAMISFVFIASFAIVQNQKAVVIEKTLAASSETKNYPKIPVLKSGILTFPVISAQSVLAEDLDSGVTLYEKNSDKAVLPASTTKIVTSLVIFDHYPLDEEVVVPPLSVEGQKMGLVQGEKMKIIDLLDGLLIYSANDAAEALSRIYCEDGTCGRDVFIRAMNQKVRDLGLTNTNFVNPTGLDEPMHYSTARDLVRVSVEAMKNPVFAEIVGTKEKVVTSSDGKIVHKLKNINELLGEVDGVLGIKTGWTEGARENLVTYVDRNGQKILIALLGSQDRFGETKEMIDWLYGSYEWNDVVYDGQ